MRRSKAWIWGPALAGLMAAAFGPLAAAQSTTNYPVGVANCEGESPICNPAQHFTVTTDGALSAEVVADADNCTAIVVRVAVDGAPAFESEGVAPGASSVAELGPVTAGTHTISVEADVPISFSCDFRAWSGTLAVTTSGVAASDVAFAGPGDVVTVSTALLGFPRPAGITATLSRSPTAMGTAQFSVATYAGIPSVLIPSPPPIRAAAFLDLQLTNADARDVIAGQFLPPNPIQPSPPPIVPPNPIIPSGPPILPPSPIRLAWWTGSDWSPVLAPSGPPILPVYDSVASVFTFDFTALSSPSVLQLGGTVFAVIPNYYFRGFGTPVDAETLNVAKAGRAIPLKWQVFDETVEPVLDLDPVRRQVVLGRDSLRVGRRHDRPARGICGGRLGPAEPRRRCLSAQLEGAEETTRARAGGCGSTSASAIRTGAMFYRTADFQFTR